MKMLAINENSRKLKD